MLCMAVLGMSKSRDRVLHVMQYTMLNFGFSSLCMLRQYKEKEYATLHVYNSLLLIHISIITIP